MKRNDNGRQLTARPDGRVVEKNKKGKFVNTSKIVLATGHSHPKASGGVIYPGLNRANESIRRNSSDQALSKVAPAVVKTPSSKIKVFVDKKEVKEKN